MVSFKNNIYRCLEQLELGRSFSGGGCLVGPNTNKPWASQIKYRVGECRKESGLREMGLSGEDLSSLVTREAQKHYKQYDVV